ncbi:TetR/AcrR family transcriptional regulator [Bradyrhizobium jicamae]|uniref:TetR/AcrR family transcriptional regulator n=1 Tax=Bradyrhizobium jicamae TaxID=280332 RepID=UPI001BA4E1B4|nr:TetR/AcrR family transcriptional regulator [Bradyrhizobium jicamae]MBR0755737.1 TetR/AcrR family transcriptional regulator [Bradyrhizobium jicamae]
MKSKRSAPRRGPRATKREAILEAGTKIFLERGFGATSMDEVAVQANVSKRTVYDYFESKEGLFAAVVQELCERITPPEFLARETEEEVEDVLKRFGEWFLARIYSVEQINLFQTVINDSRQFPDIGNMMFSGPVKRTQDAVASYFATQVRKGRLVLKDTTTAAALFIAMLKGDTHMKLLFGQSREALQKEIRRNVSTTVRLFLNGAREG